MPERLDLRPSSTPSPPAAGRGPRLATVVAVVLTASLGSLALVALAALRTVAPVPPEQLTEATSAHGETVAAPVAADTRGYALWATNDDGLPVRWDACRPVDLVVDPTGAPPGARQDLARALTLLSEATGLELRVIAEVEERPHRQRPPYQPERYGERWAPVLVAWATPHENGVPLRDTDRGLAIPIAVGPEGMRSYVTGQVLLNAERDDLVPGFADRATSWGATLVHELAHVLGLAHVDDPDQLMHVHPGTGPVTLGAGDLAGLTAVGAGHGCLPAPDARPIEVAAPHRH